VKTFSWQVTRLLVVLVAVTFASFTMVSLLPGDTVDAVLGARATEEAREEAREELNLDDPIVVRYSAWLGDAVQGDLGTSYRTNQPVSEAIGQRLGVTIELVLLSQLFALLLAVPMAIVAARRPGSNVDRGTNGVALGLLAVPSYMAAVGLITVFAVKLDWFPTTGFTRITENPVENLRSLILPALALALPEVALYMRLMRSEMVEVLQQDYITAAHAKGLPNRYVTLRHAIRPSSFALVTLLGITIGRMIGGTILVESIFGIPGLGRYTIDAINNRDFVALQGAVVVFTVAFVVINFLVDRSYGVLDPRVQT
jgi:peptide/nickel transport system permease protein